jgi:phosphoglucosamine mutase
MEAMRASGAALGGEDSGHMIFAEHHTTGDGILSALMLVAAVLQQGRPLSRLKTVMNVFPQALINVAVASKPSLDDLPPVRKAIQEAQSHLGGSGRVLVRYSGTESLCRVMVEGPNREAVEAFARSIARAVAEAIG